MMLGWWEIERENRTRRQADSFSPWGRARHPSGPLPVDDDSGPTINGTSGSRCASAEVA
jgi:hypothetical protein